LVRAGGGFDSSLCAVLVLATVAYVFTTGMSAIALWRAPKEGVRTAARRFFEAVVLALLVAAAYLAYWGIIGLRTFPSEWKGFESWCLRPETGEGTAP
jgi:hypothetical protein